MIATSGQRGTVSGDELRDDGGRVGFGRHLAALATTNLWQTPDGSEPLITPAELGTWPARYLWSLCRWLAAPADNERAAAVRAEVAACPDEHRGLREELQRWTVVAHGTPEYALAVANHVATPAAIPARSGKRRRKA